MDNYCSGLALALAGHIEPLVLWFCALGSRGKWTHSLWKGFHCLVLRCAADTCQMSEQRAAGAAAGLWGTGMGQQRLRWFPAPAPTQWGKNGFLTQKES